MAFEDDFAHYIDQIKARLPHIRGEEATKQSLVVPLFHVLGYDVWNPLEVQPEYGADFSKGAKRGQLEKVDFALKINGEPVVFVECKAADVILDAHDGQLARYFNATPSVRVGILTNGVRMKVFTDLQQPNVMDDKPWMDFDIRAPKQAELDALKKFRKAEFTADQIVGLAEEMVYYNVLVPFIASQLIDPGDKLVRLVAEEIPSLKRIDKKIVDRLTPILRKAIQAAILDHVARSFDTKDQFEEPAPEKDLNQTKEDGPLPSKKFNPIDPPDLLFTRCHGEFGSLPFRKWSSLVRIAHIQAFAKEKSFEKLKTITSASIREGDYAGKDGYRFVSEIGISIRSLDANSAWQHALLLARYLNIPLRVTVEWLQHEKSAFPGEIGTMEWIP